MMPEAAEEGGGGERGEWEGELRCSDGEKYNVGLTLVIGREVEELEELRGKEVIRHSIMTGVLWPVNRYLWSRPSTPILVPRLP
jgi:hypothetical protein